MYKPLLEIRVEHPFFANGLCAPARVIPSPSAADRIRGLRLIARARPGGLGLVADIAADGTAKVAVPDCLLRFELLQLEAGLLAATDLGTIVPGTVFTDGGADKPMKPAVREARSSERFEKPAGPATLVLKGRPLEGSATADFKIDSPAGISVKGYDSKSRTIRLDGPAAETQISYPVAPANAPGSLTGIEIPLGPALVAKAAAGKPKRFTVALKAAEAPWCFHLVTDLPNPAAEWRIDHPAKDGPPAAFGAGSVAEISAADPADRFGSELLERSAPLRVLRFVSDSAVPCSEARARRMALFAGARQLFTALPNPSPFQVRLLNGKPAFGEVLRFVTA